MGIVKINEELHEEVRRASVAMVRSINAQAEFWMKMGMLAELNPGLTYLELLRQLLQQAADAASPASDAQLVATAESCPVATLVSGVEVSGVQASGVRQ